MRVILFLLNRGSFALIQMSSKRLTPISTEKYCQWQINYGSMTGMRHSLVELDSLNEDYYIEYIDYILKDGRGVEAMNLYHQYQICLKKELGLTPSLKLKSLMSQMMRLSNEKFI